MMIKVKDIGNFLKKTWPLLLGVLLSVSSLFLVFFRLNQYTTYVSKTQIQIKGNGKLKSNDEVCEKLNEIVKLDNFKSDLESYIVSNTGKIIQYTDQKLELVKNKYSVLAYVKSSSNNQELSEFVSSEASDFLVLLCSQEGKQKYAYSSLLEGANLIRTNEKILSDSFVRFSKYTYIGSAGISLFVTLSTAFVYFEVDKRKK